MSSCSTICAGYSTIGFSLFQYKDLLSRLCFSRALHSANCLILFFLCHYNVYYLMMAAVSYLFYYSPTFRADRLCNFVFILICFDKFGAVGTIPLLYFQLISGGFVNIIFIHYLFLSKMINTQIFERFSWL